MGVFRTALSVLGARDRRRLVWLLILTGGSALLEMAMVASVVPFLTSALTPGHPPPTGLLGQLLGASGLPVLKALGGLAIGAIIASGLASMAQTHLMYRFATDAGLATGSRVFEAQLRQPYAYFLDRHSGELSNLVLSESAQVIEKFLLPACRATAALCTVTAILGFLLWLDPLVSLVSMGALGSIYGLTYWASRRATSRHARTRIAASADRSRLVVEAFGGIKAVKLASCEETFTRLERATARRISTAFVSASVIAELPRVVVQSLGFCIIVLLCLVLVLAGDGQEGLMRALPLLGLFAFAGMRVMPALGTIYGNLSQLRYGSEVVRRVAIEIARARDLPPPPPAEVGRLRLRHALTLDGIGFSYAGGRGGGLHAISLTIRRGERIGLVGASGAGKTTLADIVLGLLRPQAGSLSVDGTPVTDGSVALWQRSVSYVPQDIFLTNGSVLENIAFGQDPEQIDRDRAIRCAVAVQLDPVISALPDGYRTPVGERGVRLSGGQRQRVGIARALYADADLLVFDEATSALDSLTEEAVMKAIAGLPGDKTMLLVAHRLSTLRGCDRIVLLDQGRIVACGPWETLIESSAPFRALAAAAGLLPAA